MKTKIIITTLFLGVVALICYGQTQPIAPLILRFLDLTDVDETTYTGEAGKYMKVNAGETALEFGTPAGAGDLLADGSVPMTANWDIGNFDITLKSLTGDGSLDFGGGVSTELVNSAAPTTDATGEIALDTTIADHQPLWQYYDGGENMTVIAIDTAQLPALDNEVVGYDAATDKWILEAPGAGNDVYIEEGDAAKVDSTGADLYVDFDGTDFDVGVVGNEGNISIVLDKDVVATSPLLVDGVANVDDILPGADADLTISATIAKDIVTTSPLTVNAGANLDNVIIGTDADITIAIADADDDGATKGAASFDNTDFDAAAGNVTIVDDGHAHTTVSISGLLDADVADNITIDLATLATTVTVSDDEATADNQEVVFTTDNTNLESDGDFHYNPNTGTVTATEFVGGGSGLTLASTDLSDTAALLYELELDTFAELDTQIADKALINLADGGTFTGNVIANANLSVGNATTTAGVLTLLEDDDDGANFASFMVPTLAANTVYTLPPDDGDNTEVLQTNGAGVLTWVANAGGGATAWDDISDPDNNGATTITFDNAETTIFTGDNDAAVSFITIQNTDGDHTVGQMYLLDLDYSADDGDTEADFLRCQDSGGDVFTIGQNGDAGILGDVTITGSLEAGTMTEGLIAVPNVDETDWVDEDEMADSDHGDVQWAAGVAYVQAATIADSTYASCYVGLFQAATGNNEPFYTDGGLTYDATTGTLSSTVLTEGGLAVYNSGETPGGSLGGTWAAPTIDDLFIKLGGDVATAGDYDFGSANVDLELPQTSPAVPDVDGQVEIDFTDGKVVLQHGSAHAELGSSTDVIVGTLIKSWSGTIFEPDGVNDVLTVKAINSIEFPHGVVITAIYLGVSENSNYTLTVQNFDDFDTINGANPTIDAVAYVADATGEIIDSTPTFATIAAGQIIMISIPATDVDWIHFEIYYYEPAA